MSATQSAIGITTGGGDGGEAVTVLRPRRGWSAVRPVELWRYRDLLWLLALRDVQVRYKQTALGVAWAVIQPVVTMTVFSIFFGRLMGVEERTGGVAYPVFVFAGLVPWTLFAAAVTAAGQSLVGQAAMLGKVYFPRLILPLAATGAPLADAVISLLVLGGLMAWFGAAAGWGLLWLPALLLTTLAAATGVGILLAALTVTYRDFRYVVPFMIQTWFFLTPVIWPVTIVPERYRAWLALNPMSGTVDAFRAAIVGGTIDYAAWGLSATVAAACLLIGLAYFRRAERRFADVV